MITTTPTDELYFSALVIEDYVGYGYTMTQLARRYSLDISEVDDILQKYSPKHTDRKLIITVGSKLNH